MRTRIQLAVFGAFGLALALSGCNCGGPPECGNAQECATANGAAPCGAWECNAGKCEVDCPGCTDVDKDGYGPDVGACAGPDCDDTNDQLTNVGTRACYSGPANTVGTGVCVQGTQICTAGQWAGCQGEVLPAGIEACNGKDDTCDSQVDEGLPTVTCGLGACQMVVAGCSNGNLVQCVPGTPAADDSLCNGIDDDCDGPIDEDCVIGCVRVDNATGSDTTAPTNDAGTPFFTIQAAINFAFARHDPVAGGMNVCVASTAGGCGATKTYILSAPLVMADGVSVLGGYAVNNWTRCPSPNVSSILALQDGRGVLFGSNVVAPTVLDGFTLARTGSAASLSAITVSGAQGARVSNVLVPANTTTTTYAYGVNVIDGGQATVSGSTIFGGDGTLETVAVRAVAGKVTVTSNCPQYNDAGTCDLTGLGGNCVTNGAGIFGKLNALSAAQESYGVLLQDAPGSVVELSNVCANRAQYGAAVRVRGDGDQVVIRGNSLIGAGGTVDSHGIWTEDCNAKAPISNNSAIYAQAASGSSPTLARSEGIHSVGACHPVIDHNQAISGAAEGQTNEAYGVFCGANAGGISSKCDVLSNAAIGGSSGGYPPISAAVWCQNGGCNRIEGNMMAGGQSGANSYGVWLQNTGATVANNTITGGTCSPAGVGVYAETAYARIVNNKILGAVPPVVGISCGRPNRFSVGMVVTNGAGPNEVDVHSNTVSGGGNPLIAGCLSAALMIGSGTSDGGVAPAAGGQGVYRNNILRGGDCATRYGVWELDAGTADPRVFQNNDLDPTFTSGSLVIYLDEGGNAINLVSSVNGAADMSASGNISANPYLRNYVAFDWHLDAGSPCIDMGTSTGAPVRDIDDEVRDPTPDIGFDEFK